MNGMCLKGMLAAVFLFPLAAGAAPVATAGPDQTVLDREGDGAETVILDSSSSTGSITAWEWKNGDTVLSTEIRCLATLPVGTNAVTLRITDDQAQTATDTLQVVINPLSGRKQRRNLKDAPTADRFVCPTNLVWPAAAGQADICLWKDDKFAAFFLSVDDNCSPNHDWWISICNQYGWKMTWFVVTSSVTNNPGFSGPWSAFQRLADLGHDIQSHTINHYSNGADRTDAEMIVQYRDAIAAMEANLTGVRVPTIAWPYGSYKREVGAMFHIAGRGVSAVSKAGRTDYMQVSATSSGINPAYIDATLYGTSSISWLNNSGNLRGWGGGLYHYITNTAQKVAEVEYLASKTNLWVGTFTDVAKYGQERDTVTLTMRTNRADGVTFTLSDEMDDTLFDYPLTVKVKMHPGWLGVQATQNGAAIESKVVSYNGDLYALVQAVPDQGEILLTPGSAANFTASPVSGWAPLTVTFTDTSTISGVTNRFWDFGDGFTTNTSAPGITHTYLSAETCTVQLVVGSPDGTDTNTQPGLIRITLPVAPSAAFSTSPSSGWAPLSVTFADTSTGDITNRFWDFGDGATTNTGATNISHAYTSAGTNTVRLIVSGPAGSSTNTQIAAVTVTVPTAPSAAFNAAPLSGTAPLSVAFTDTSTGSITNRFWNFGDGFTTNTTVTNLTRLYTAAGTKTVTLVVSGPTGVSTNVQANLISVESSSSGPLIVYDSFTAPTNKLGSVGGWAPAGWTATDLTTANANAYIRTNSLSVMGLQASQGNSLGLQNKTGDYYLDFSTVTLGVGDTIYFSFIQKFNVIPGSTVNGAAGYIRLGNNADAVSVTKGICIGRGSDGTPAANNAGFALSANSSVYSTVGTHPKTAGIYDMTATYFIVGSYTRGAGAADGSLKLWINPDSATFGTVNAPAPTLSMASLSSADTFNRLLINGNGSGSWPTDWQVDEVRIGTGWAQVAPSETPAPTGDTDSDGIPDEWETLYFGSATNANPNSMAANGVNTVMETYVAGLNPTNPVSVFLISDFRPLTSGSILQWSSVSGRVYGVYWTTNLMNSFQPLETNILWPQNSWTGLVSGSQGDFYKIKVQLVN